jgi:hypothetical protein
MALTSNEYWLPSPYPSPGGRPEWSLVKQQLPPDWNAGWLVNRNADNALIDKLFQKDKPMVYDVLFTLKAKKQLPTGEFIEVERVLGRSEAVPASSDKAAIAIAARQLATTVGDEELGAAAVSVKNLSA